MSTFLLSNNAVIDTASVPKKGNDRPHLGDIQFPRFTFFYLFSIHSIIFIESLLDSRSSDRHEGSRDNQVSAFKGTKYGKNIKDRHVNNKSLCNEVGTIIDVCAR